jgi:TonB family protein
MAGFVVVGGPIVWRWALLQRPSLRQDEAGFRESALYSVSPEYPSDLLHLSIEGVAVAQVRVQPAGAVDAVEVLEAPHAEVSRAVAKALLQWRFPVVKVPGYYLAARVRGKAG